MDWRSCTVFLRVLVFSVLMIPLAFHESSAQGLPQSPYSSPSIVREGLDLTPSNPLAMPGTSGGLPRGADSIYLTDRMFSDILGSIPNLQAGYLYYFGNGVDTSRLTLDYLLPVRLGQDSAVFGQAHGECTNFWKTFQRLFRSGNTVTSRSDFHERTDLSIGGGYRTLLNESTLLGVNAFFDTTKLGSGWYSSGSLGIEYAALLPGNDAADIIFNWYGNLFNSNVLANAFRRGPENYDLQAGYSHELWNGGPDLRLSATGYRFDAGSALYGGRAGAELKTRDGMFSLKYEAAYDPLNKTYHTVGGFVNVGIRMSNLLNGESPFVMPEPIFRSPRNLRRRLTTVVRRQSNGPGPPTATVSTMARCPMNACGTNPLTPNLRGEYQVNMPATMTNGQVICLDVPDTTVSFGYLSIFITRYGTNGDIYFSFYEASNDCTGLALGVLLPDSQTAYCVTGFSPNYSVWSIRATCVGPTGCDAGCINFQWWQD